MTVKRESVFIGIDVGGKVKGFHAIALRDGQLTLKHAREPDDIAGWCIEQDARVVAVDAPAVWADPASGYRAAERSMNLFGQKLHCFATPTRARAQQNTTGFYGWMFRGEALFRELRHSHALLGIDDDRAKGGRFCFETFPHAVACALTGRVLPARDKSPTRREVLRQCGFDDAQLPNIDYVDAALCALAARSFAQDKAIEFGPRAEGCIVVPRPGTVIEPASTHLNRSG